MTIPAYTKFIHPILEANGFRRKKNTWNRNIAEYVDVVNLQISKSRDMVALNVGVFEREIYSQVWRDGIPEFVEIASCIVNTRVGMPDHGVDKCWDLDDPTGPAQVSEKISDECLSFFDGMHSINNLEMFLENSGVRKSYYPLPSIYLSVALIFNKKTVDGCNLLRELRSRNLGDWRPHVDAMLLKFCEGGC